jgi:cytochrome c-type biogenesis protein CcmH
VNLQKTLLILILAWPAAVIVALDADQGLQNPDQRALYEQLIDEVRCLVCQNQTVADSNAPLAADLRRAIRDRVAEGQSERQIKEFLTERYGEFILYRPRFLGAGTLLWLAPGFLLLIGIFVLWTIVRRRAKLPVPSETDDAIPSGADSEWKSD